MKALILSNLVIFTIYHFNNGIGYSIYQLCTIDDTKSIETLLDIHLDFTEVTKRKDKDSFTTMLYVLFDSSKSKNSIRRVIKLNNDVLLQEDH